MFRRFGYILALASAALAAAPAAYAQTVTVTTPRPVNPDGTPSQVGKTFIVNADGTIATVSGGGAVTCGGAPCATAAKQDVTNATIGTPGSTAPTSGQLVMGSDGTNARAITTDTSGRVSVFNVSTTPFYIRGSNVANDAVDADNPIKIGGYASTTAPTAVSAGGDRVNAWYGLNGQAVSAAVAQVSGTDGVSNALLGLWQRIDNGGANVYAGVFPFVFDGTTWNRTRGDTNGTVNQPYAMSASRWTYAAASGGISNTTTAVTVKTAAGASTFNYVTGIQCVAGPLGAATEVAYRDGAGGTVLWRGFLGTAGGTLTFSAGVPLKGTANTLGEVVTLTATITGGVYCNVQGFTSTL